MFKTLVTISAAIVLTSCAWVGVERQRVEEKELSHVFAKDVVPESTTNIEIKSGISKAELVSLLGQSDKVETDDRVEILAYPAAYKVRSGITVCLALIPVPLRSSARGEYRFYFNNRALYKITKTITGGGFYGFYVDDSGSGAVGGEKSKCDV